MWAEPEGGRESGEVGISPLEVDASLWQRIYMVIRDGWCLELDPLIQRNKLY